MLNQEQQLSSVAEATVFELAHRLRVPAGPPGVYNHERRTLLVRLVSSDGVVGWGETYALPGFRAALEAAAERLVGAPVDRAVAPERPASPAAIAAASALELALHDLIGKTLGVPAYRLLGARLRDRVPVYASGFLYRPDALPAVLWPEEAERLVRRGFRALKLRIGAFDPADELPLLAALRHELPDDVELMVDAWGAYTLPTAIEVAAVLADLGVRWFEEPAGPRETYPGYEALHAVSRVPIAGGEALTSVPAFEQLLDRRVLDVVQPDPSLCGGLAATAAVARLAAERGVECAPHTWNGGVMAAATLHLLATLDTPRPVLEYDTTENPFVRDLLSNPPELVDGCFTVPDAPGLGVEIDETALRSYAT
jgi:D-galactarolactone cycloisomerase